jgi:hypothetical protein
MICKTDEQYALCLRQAKRNEQILFAWRNSRDDYIATLEPLSAYDPPEKWQEQKNKMKEWDRNNPTPPDPEWPIGPNEHYFVSRYGCPVHHHGHDPEERLCSCRTYWAEDASGKAWREDHDIASCKAAGGACARRPVRPNKGV